MLLRRGNILEAYLVVNLGISSYRVTAFGKLCYRENRLAGIGKKCRAGARRSRESIWGDNGGWATLCAEYCLSVALKEVMVSGGDVFSCYVDDREKGDRQVAPTGPKTKSVGAIMAGFKSAVAKRINAVGDTPRRTGWQHNYFEHIIRDGTDYTRIAEYVPTNPRR